MHDYNTLTRMRWLRRLQHGGKNAHGIEAEELAYYLSERFALIAVGALVFGVIMEIMK